MLILFSRLCVSREKEAAATRTDLFVHRRGRDAIRIVVHIADRNRVGNDFEQTFVFAGTQTGVALKEVSKPVLLQKPSENLHHAHDELVFSQIIALLHQHAHFAQSGHPTRENG